MPLPYLHSLVVDLKKLSFSDQGLSLLLLLTLGWILKGKIREGGAPPRPITWNKSGEVPPDHSPPQK